MMLRALTVLLAISLGGSGSAQPSQPPRPSVVGPEGRQPEEQPAAVQQGTDKDERGTSKSPLVIQIQPTKDADRAAARDEQRADRQASADWWLVALTGFLALVALGTGVVVGWQAHETRRTANATIQQVKSATSPRVYIDGLEVSNFEYGKEPIFFLRVANAGPVQADGVKVFIEVQHQGGGTKPEQANAILVPANGFRRYDFRSNFVLPLDQAGVDALDIRIMGRIDHGDQIAEFCFKYNQWSGERPEGVPLFVPCDYDHRRHVNIVVSGALKLSGQASHVVLKDHQLKRRDSSTKEEGQPKDQP